MYLRDLKISDFKEFKKYSKDTEVHKYTTFEIFQYANKIGIKKYIQKNQGSSFAICDVKNNKLIGDAGFSLEGNKVEIGLAIFDRNYWNKGYGQEVVKKLINFIRKKYKNNQIILTVHKQNIRAIKCYKKVGFEISGNSVKKPNEYLMILTNRTL